MTAFETFAEFESAIVALPAPGDPLLVAACRRVAMLTPAEVLALVAVSSGSLEDEDKELSRLTGIAFDRLGRRLGVLHEITIKARTIAGATIWATLRDRNATGRERTAVEIVEELLTGFLAGIVARDVIDETHFERLVAPFAAVTGFRP